MNFRTTFNIDPSVNKINYNTPVMFIGSCFATEIGTKMADGKMKVQVNPSGVVYNPVSIGNIIDIILENRVFSENDLFNYKGINLSFSHYTNFSSEDPSAVIEKINLNTRAANQFLKQASFLFLTFGTSRVYRLIESGKIVSNCHKLPSAFFSEELLTAEKIVSSWIDILDRLHSFNNRLRIIFTVSPVRHWKDGAHANQISKSILLLSIEKLLGHQSVERYFPAYELIMDDLRDYRYYADDMLHLSPTAINYIWKAFSDCYFSSETYTLWKEAESITRAMNHRFLTDSPAGKREFAGTMLDKISAIEKKNPDIELMEEKSYFLKIRKGNK